METASGVQKLAIYDPATKTVVQLNYIAPDGNYTPNFMNVEAADGTFLYSGVDSAFEANVFDETGYDQLETWMKNDTPVRIVAYGKNVHVLWYEDSKIVVKKNYVTSVGKKNGFNLKITFKGGTNSIKALSNILLGNGLWQDLDTDGEVDALTFPAGSYVPTFVTEEQVLTSGGVESKDFYTKVEFPVEGVEISADFIPSTQENTIEVAEIIALDKDDNVLTSVDISDGNSHTLTTPASTYYIKFLLTITFGTAGYVTSFPVPAGINY